MMDGHKQMLLTATLKKWANICCNSIRKSEHLCTEPRRISEDTKRARDLELTSYIEDIQMSCVVILEQEQLFNFYKGDPSQYSQVETL
jgi:hypothetical protein